MARFALSGVILEAADLRNASLKDIEEWEEIESLDNANIRGVVLAPPGFIKWAIEQKGAVNMGYQD